MPARTPRSASARPRIVRNAGRSRVARTLLAFLTASLLAACGTIPGVGGPVELGDPLNLNGYQFRATMQDGALTTQGVSHASRAMRSDDMPDLSTRLYGFEVVAFEAEVGLRPEATLTRLDPDAAPQRFVITRARVDAELSDGHAGVSFRAAHELDLPFVREACTDDACTYRYDGTEPLDDVLSVRWTDRDTLAELVRVLTENDGTGRNAARLEVSVEAESEGSLSGASIAFRLTSSGSRVELD